MKKTIFETNNNTSAIVYYAVMVTIAIVRVHLVYVMNAYSTQGGH